jgi:hypothetical protein
VNRDIVDTEPYYGDVWKMLLGPFDPVLDNDPVPDNDPVLNKDLELDNDLDLDNDPDLDNDSIR